MTGALHLVSSLLAMLFGAIVMLAKKGTRSHKILGYSYVICMITVLITALLIYRLFDGFGPFHYIAVGALYTCSLG